jgi:poly [ADP-ribose] polymerase
MSEREPEYTEYNTKIGNDKLLFHGSGAHNWVGILSRGLLLPKQVVKLGVHRTDQGWLGHGIYFGDSISTALNYASSGRSGSTFIGVANVALGKIKEYTEITYGLNSPRKDLIVAMVIRPSLDRNLTITNL